MNLNYLKTFETVAACRNFAKAAELLYISQPAVSQQIKSIENELGFTLFDRSPHNVTMTPAGQRFLTGVSEMLRIYEDTLHACGADQPGEATIHIYYVGFMSFQFLPRILQAFQKEYPTCHAEANRLSPADAVAEMRKGGNGIYLVPECIIPYRRKMKVTPLYEDRHYIVMRKSNPLNTGSPVTLESLSGHEICIASAEYRPSHMETTLHLIRQLAEPPVINEALGIDSTMPRLLSTDAAAIMPGYTIPFHPELTRAVLEDGVSIPVAAVTFTEKNAMEEAFIRLARETLKSK